MKPETFKDNFAASVLKNWGRMHLQPCDPPKYLRDGHMQTIVAHVLPSPKVKAAAKEELLKVSGGDKIHLTIYKGKSKIVFYLFHGLGGDTEQGYMQRIARIAIKRGHTVILANHRDCGKGKGHAKEPYHSGRADDLSAVIAYGRKHFPKHKHLSAGFSLSANASLLMAAGFKSDVQPDAVIAVNAPIDLEKCSKLLLKGMNRIYDVVFVRDMRKLVKEPHRNMSDIQLPRKMTLRDFDALYTGVASGYGDRDNYYATCSANQYLKDISIPTFVLTAEDDPFIDFKDYKKAKMSKFVIMRIEKHGGHLGYLSKRTPLGTYRWLDYALDQLIEGFENAVDNKKIFSQTETYLRDKEI